MPALTDKTRLREIVLVGTLLTVIGAVVFGSHIRDGGFYSDDWFDAAEFATGGYRAVVVDDLALHPGRPLYAPIDAARFVLLGPYEPSRHHILSIALVVLTSLAFYALARRLRFRQVEAFGIAALTVLFPWALSIRLWPTGSLNTVPVILFICGVVANLRMTETTGARAWISGGTGTALLVASVLTYPVASVIAPFSGLVYIGRTTLRRGFSKWSLDTAAVAAASVYSVLGNPNTPKPLRAQIANAYGFTKTGATLTLNALVPSATTSTSRAAAALATVLVLVTGAWVGWRAAPERRSAAVRRLVIAAVAAAVCVPLSHAAFVPPADRTAWSPGLEDRVNVLAALPITAFVVCIAALVVSLVVFVRPALQRASAVLVVALLIAIGIGYVARIDEEKRAWAHATDEANEVLAAINVALPSIPENSTLYTFGHRAQVKKGVHVFSASWDLWGAVRLHHGATLNAYPALEGITFRCGRDGVSANGSFYFGIDEDLPEVGYGNVFFVDVPSRTADGLENRAECREAVSRHEPGRSLNS